MRHFPTSVFHLFYDDLIYRKIALTKINSTSRYPLAMLLSVLRKSKYVKYNDLRYILVSARLSSL